MPLNRDGCFDYAMRDVPSLGLESQKLLLHLGLVLQHFLFDLKAGLLQSFVEINLFLLLGDV